MIRVHPLRAMVARAGRAAKITAPQYDSIPPGQRHDFALRHPDCFINITLSAEDFPEPRPDPAAVAERAAGHWREMKQRGLYEEHPAPAFFLYRLSDGGGSQTGLVAGVGLEAAAEGRVKGHEGIIESRARDLTGFYRTARLTSSPVALAFRADRKWLSLLDRLTDRPPLRDFSTGDEVRQQLWAVDDPEEMAEAAEAAGGLDSLYVTDGHHRVAASQEEGAAPGWFMAAMFPARQMRVLEYNRCVVLDEKPDLDEFFRRLGPDWEVTGMGWIGSAAARPSQPGDISMLTGGAWRRLRFRGGRSEDPVEGLDVSLLHDRILGPALGVTRIDDRRLSLVVGADAVDRLERRARNDERVMGFALCPVPIEQLLAVADAGRLMPPKSTWFTPKPRSGLVVAEW